MKVKEVRSLYEKEHVQRKKARLDATSSVRMSRWPEAVHCNYECILDSGVVYDKVEDIADQEDGFCIYRHRQYQSMDRNSTYPVYEAAYVLSSGTLVRVQKGQLRRVYAKLGRSDQQLTHTLLPDGTPYWVDRLL